VTRVGRMLIPDIQKQKIRYIQKFKSQGHTLKFSLNTNRLRNDLICVEWDVKLY